VTNPKATTDARDAPKRPWLRSKSVQWVVVAGLGIVVLLAGLVLTVFVAKPVEIAWHRRQVAQASEELQYASPGTDGTPIFARLKKHLDRLALLGTVVKREYRFKNLQTRTDASREFFKRIVDEDCPPWLHVTSQESKDPEPYKFTVWFEPEHEEDWDRFVREADVATPDEPRPPDSQEPAPRATSP
jgi:hypothetical protein